MRSIKELDRILQDKNVTGFETREGFLEFESDKLIMYLDDGTKLIISMKGYERSE